MIKLNFFTIYLVAAFFTSYAYAEMGIPVKVKLKSPAGVYPSESGLSVKLLVLSTTNNCILREEDFSGQTITNGSLVVYLGSGVRGVNDPSLSLSQVFDNSKSKSGLSCVDANSVVISTGQIYSPAVDAHRVIRILTTISAEPIVLNFNMKSTPYAVQAESVGGKSASELIVNEVSTQLNQTNLSDLLFDVTRFNNLKNLAMSGQAVTANSATTAVNFTGVLAGDVTGTQGVSTVVALRGSPISATAPTVGQVLQYNGTQYVPVAIPSAAVSSVAGRTGAVVLSSSDVSGLGSAAGLNVGTVAGTVAAGNDLRLSDQRNPIDNSVTSLKIVDGSITSSDLSVGSVTLDKISGSGAVVGQVLKWDGSSWSASSDLSGAGSVAAVTASAPLVSSGGINPNISMSQANSTTNGFLSSTDWNAFNSKLANFSTLTSADVNTALGFAPVNSATAVTSVAGRTGSVVLSNADISGLGGAAILNVGTGAGTVAAGDDARITGALPSSIFNGYVISANCTVTQSLYWNSVAGQFMCQNISFPSDLISSVAGRTGAIVLSSADVSGLGSAAGLNVGSVAGTVAAGDDLRIVNSDLAINAATDLNTASVLVKRDATGSFSAQNLNLAGDANVTGVMNGLTKNTIYQSAPTTAGVVTAYTLSYGAAADAKILANTAGDSVRFKVHATNTGAATLKVGGAPAASLFSAFTGLSVNAGDLQIGFYEAIFDGTNWLVKIPPRVYKNAAVINWAATTALSITAAGVNSGDYVTCSLSQGTATAQTTTRYWTTSVLVRAGVIDVVGVRVGTPPNVTGVRCMVQK